MADPLITVCSKCGHTNQADALTCSNCGARLAPVPNTTSATSSEAAPVGRSGVPQHRNLLPYLGFGAFVVAFLGILGAPTDLVCQRAVLGAPSSINCVQTTRLLWFIPMSPRQIYDVRGAQIASGGGDYEGYRVELLTGQGMQPLMSGYTSGSMDKQGVADQINAFVQGWGPSPLTLTEPGLLNTENVLCSVIWLFGLAVWSLLKSFFKRPATPP